MRLRYRLFDRRKSALKSRLFATESVVIVIIALGYTGLVFVLVDKWSNLAGEAIIGYALFAQGALRAFFEFLHKKNGQDQLLPAAKP